MVLYIGAIADGESLVRSGTQVIGGAGGGGGYNLIQNEGVGLTVRTTLNFIGPGITAADDAPGTRTNVTISTAVASGLANANAEGTADSLARSDHTHKRDVRIAVSSVDVGTRNRLNWTGNILTATDDAVGDEVDMALPDYGLVGDIANVDKSAAAAGVSARVARADHKHDITTATAVGLANVNAEGGGVELARAAHTHKRDVRVAKAGVDVGTRNRLNFIDGTNMSVGIVDDGAGDELDITVAWTGVTVRKNSGADVGTRPRLNFIEGANMTITVADDAPGGEVDLTFVASLAGGGYATIQDEGVAQTQRSILNFIGPGVVAADDGPGARTNVTISLVDHNHTATAGDGGILTNDEHDGYSQYAEIAAPATPGANLARFYGADEAGETLPFWKAEDGVARRMGGIWEVYFIAGTVTWTNMPLADTEFINTPRNRLDLTNIKQARLIVQNAAGTVAAGADLRAQYSTDGAAFSNLDGAAGPELAISPAAADPKDTGWFDIAAAARADNIRLRIMGKDGDGAADPQFRIVMLHFR